MPDTFYVRRSLTFCESVAAAKGTELAKPSRKNRQNAIEGAILGRALYDGDIIPAEAIHAAQKT